MLRTIVCLMFFVLSFGLSNVSAQTARTSSPLTSAVLNGNALSLPQPGYPAAARAVKAGGVVNVAVKIDEEGNVITAVATSGHPLLRQAAVEAARKAIFKRTLLSGQAVSITGLIVYNFSGLELNFNNIEYWTNTGFLIGMHETRGSRRLILPDEFSEEEKQLETTGKLSPPEQTALTANNIASIKAKLNPANLWRFEFGLAKGRISANADDDNSIFTNLAKFKELTASKPEGVESYEFKRAVKLAEFAGKGKLTDEDKKMIFSYLR